MHASLLCHKRVYRETGCVGLLYVWELHCDKASKKIIKFTLEEEKRLKQRFIFSSLTLYFSIKRKEWNHVAKHDGSPVGYSC